ncbi:hypothetical protein [Saccharicrinis sp. 156]|uniref:hypothetical protein n=1 Tax=Saccharicrinis sp. 156 TaxID=3417574 RepID=UPI003D358CAC
MNAKLFLSTILIGFCLCNCDQIETVNDSLSAVQAVDAMEDYAQAAWHFQGVNNASDNAVLNSENTENINLKSSVGPNISITPSDLFTFPKSIVVDYGTNGTLGLDGRIRKGKLYIELENGWYSQTGSRHITTFENYFQNDYQIEGTHLVENLGENNDGNLVFSIEVSNGKVTNAQGQVTTFSQETTRTWIKGDNTPLNIWDDSYWIEGLQSGKCSSGVNYELTIRENNPLEVELVCPYIKSGILDVVIDNAPEMSIDYFVDEDKDGIADCSSSVTLKVNNIEYRIGNGEIQQ